MVPLKLRLRFNLLVAQVNYAASFNIARTTGNGNGGSSVHLALTNAKEQAEWLLDFWQDKRNQRALTGLWQDMYAAIYFAAKNIQVEWERAFSEQLEVKGLADDCELLPKVNMTLLARYENACALARRPCQHGGTHKKRMYEKALIELEVAVADTQLRAWAPMDPSLAELHDVDAVGRAGPDQFAALQLVERYKQLVGSRVPTSFLALSPFASYRDMLLARGIHNADQLRQTPISYFLVELNITPGEVARWRELAEVYRRVGAPPQAPGCAADRNALEVKAVGIVFLLMEMNLDSVAAMRDVLRFPDKLREILLDQGRPWAVAVPGEEEIHVWCARF